jgi:propanol-preferring alcohol dehydrogenase
MKAMTVNIPGPIEEHPLALVDIARPEPAAGEILARVKTCGVCRTDLHVSEGDLPMHREHVIPGHEVVGVVEALGAGCKRFRVGERIGIAWLRETCGVCIYCKRGRENLCPNAKFTGYDHDGGYGECAIVREDFAYRIPDALGDEEAAPLLCAGIIGYRAIKRAAIEHEMTVGLYGFGGSAHLAMQVLKHWKCKVYVMTRGGTHRALAESMGADWVGRAEDRPPKKLDAAILFAPAGDIVPSCMEALDRGGVLAIAGIYLTALPSLEYEKHLFEEREIRSVTANTRLDGEEFLQIAGEIPIRTHTQFFGLEQATEALIELKHDRIRGAAVLRIS